MVRIYIFCEGQTEETFVRDVLRPDLAQKEIYLSPIVLSTSPGYKGGVSSYQKIKKQIEIKCKQDATAYVTTFIDYYALPTDFPGREDADKKSDIYEKVKILENALKKDIEFERFISYIMLHEYEALLFTDIEKFFDDFDEKSVDCLRKDVKGLDNPELINDDYSTTPSRRILKCWAKYNKVVHGSLIVKKIGLNKIREKCRHFNEWLLQIESL